MLYEVITGYKKLIAENIEFKDFYINYLEKNWVIVKECLKELSKILWE